MLKSIVLVEPWIVPPKIQEEQRLRQLTYLLTQASLTRCDVWKSTEEAKVHLTTEGPYKHWNMQAIDLYVVTSIYHHSSSLETSQ